MGTDFNFGNPGNQPPGGGGSGAGGGGGNRQPGNFPLARQSSVYSLTIDEFQSSLGKDFGSMNMDELLRNIWSAEETQGMASTVFGGGSSGSGAGVPVGLQKQGSLTLPRTLSQKTVDEVWKDLAKEHTLGKSNMPQTQRQQTLGELTLEEFLARAGVVREEIQLAGKSNNAGLIIGFQQPSTEVSNFMGNRGSDNANQISIQSSNPPMNGVRSTNQQQQQQQQPIFPKQPNFSYGTQMSLQGNGIRNGMMGIGDQGLVQTAGFSGGTLGLGGGKAGVATGSPATQFSPEGTGRSNGDVSSVSPVPYMFGGNPRGRKRSGAVEKVVERRQKRMIKNRESAARSRARKQAYTTELEAEVAKLKEENEELERRQAEMLKLQNNQQAMEMMNVKGGPKKRLRRTQTGPW